MPSPSISVNAAPCGWEKVTPPEFLVLKSPMLSWRTKELVPCASFCSNHASPQPCAAIRGHDIGEAVTVHVVNAHLGASGTKRRFMELSTRTKQSSRTKRVGLRLS